MVRTFLVRGMLVGIVAGLLCFGFLKVYGEPQVDRAIAFETKMDEAKTAAEKAKGMHMAEDHELVSREAQAGLGLFTAVMVYCTAFGGLFGLAFAFAYGRVSAALTAQGVSARLAAAGCSSSMRSHCRRCATATTGHGEGRRSTRSRHEILTPFLLGWAIRQRRRTAANRF